MLLDFSFITNNLGKEFREFAYQYLVPFKNIGNLEKKIEQYENINKQNLEATLQVDETNINALEEKIKELDKQKIYEVLESARVNEFPLQVTGEAE